MKIIERTTRVERTEAIRLDDGEIRPVQFSSDGKRYRVDLVVIKWDNASGEWRLASVSIKGQVLKKDGTDSRNRTDERMWSVEGYPEWLAELIADTDPSDGAS